MDAKSAEVKGWGLDIGLLLIRVMVGVVFMFHGAQKLFGWFGGGGLSATSKFMEQIELPLPYASAVAVAIVETFGGLALLLGLWPRLAAVPVAFAMFVAAFVAHWGTFSAQQGGMEYPLTLGVVVLGLVFAGGGRITVCALVSGRRRGDSAAPNASEASGTV